MNENDKQTDQSDYYETDFVKQTTQKRQKIWLHVLLFSLTVLTTFFVGLGNGIKGALFYSSALVGILLAHEMGHYIMARKYGVPATLPYFIPMPLPPFGTMGAVIKMGGRIPDRRALFDIGVAGPLAGLIIIIPAIFFGVRLSEVVDRASIGEGALTLGDSLLFSLISRLSVGQLAPQKDILLHPLAYAGWVGLFVTALNLLPIGQLDGGHITYALFGKKSQLFSNVFYSGLLFVFLFYSAGWLLLLVLLAVFRKHPPTLNDYYPLDSRRRYIGLFALFVFILAFTPVPFGFMKGFIPMIMEQIHP